MNGKMKKCETCDAVIAINAKTCPHCGAKNKKPITKRWWFWVFIIFAVVGAVSSINGTPSTDAIPSSSTDVNASVPETESPDDKVPTEYKSALRKATSYASAMNMSKIGVYNQLTSEYGEKFTQEAAQYAIDNVKADWNANALAKAASYADTMNMSKAGIYDQLISENGEQFSKEEAQYAIDNVKVDWNANALAKAKSYQESMAMSPSSIRDQLVSEYGEKFTAEEADYAIQHLND